MERSGIYQFRNIVNNKIYIGSAIKLTKRRNRHLNELWKNRHHSFKFQVDFNEHGEKNFEYSILFYESDISRLIYMEQFYMDIILHANLNDGYFECVSLNIKKIADSSLGTKRSIESKLKMSLSAKKRFKKS